VLAAAQFEAAPPALLSMNRSAGSVGKGTTGAVGPKLRLLVSAVKPIGTQLGATALPSPTVTLLTILEPLLKVALPPPPSPATMNSAVFQLAAALTAFSPVPANISPVADVKSQKE